MPDTYTELFTPGQLSDPDEGRVLIGSLSEHLPSWTPRRYGWSEPLRNTYDPEQFGHFWSQVGYWRNATRTSEGSVEARSGPWDILSKVQVSGEWTPGLTGDELGAFLADCGAALDITYGMAHLFTPDERAAYRSDWFRLSPEPDRVKKARQPCWRRRRPMSREYHLITQDRPGSWAFVRTLTEAAGHNVNVQADFEDTDDYLNVSADDLWIEIEPPGRVEAADLEGLSGEVELPQPDDEGCLWLTVATVPAGAPGFGADVIALTFRRVAAAHHGVTVE